MRRCQPIFNLLTLEDLEKTIREARQRIKNLRTQGNLKETVKLRQELVVLEKLWKEMSEFGDYRVDSAGVVYKKVGLKQK